MKYIVGLGNPGKKYEGTRHNMGREVVEQFARAHGFSDFRQDKRTQSLQSQGTVNGEDIVCVLPDTYMNESGKTVGLLMKKEEGDLIVVHDEIDLPLGVMRLSEKSGHGGHGGVRSIVESIKTKDFIRLRIGVAKRTLFTREIKKPKTVGGVVRHVLGSYGLLEAKEIPDIQQRAVDALTKLLTDGIISTMNTYN